MVSQLESGEILISLLLVKAVLAVLAVLLFVYYKVHWEKAKRHLQIHLFYAKWRTVRHAVLLGAAAFGFAIGFSLELFGSEMGFSEIKARAFSSIFEIGALFAMLYTFFTLVMEDVPHFSHIAESAHHRHSHRTESAPKKKETRKIRRGKRKKRGNA